MLQKKQWLIEIITAFLGNFFFPPALIPTLSRTDSSGRELEKVVERTPSLSSVFDNNRPTYLDHSIDENYLRQNVLSPSVLGRWLVCCRFVSAHRHNFRSGTCSTSVQHSRLLISYAGFNREHSVKTKKKNSSLLLSRPTDLRPDSPW